AAAGTLLALATFAYSTGRVAVALFAIVLIGTEALGGGIRRRGWLAALVPIVAAYGVLATWSVQPPGALTARFSAISVGADGAPPLTVIGRFIGNYFSYFGPNFLFIDGDRNPRHHTQFGGMLLWAALPLLILGLVAMWQRRQHPWTRFIVFGLLVAPVSAALTVEGVP